MYNFQSGNLEAAPMPATNGTAPAELSECSHVVWIEPDQSAVGIIQAVAMDDGHADSV
jgi:hypothetical protein